MRPKIFTELLILTIVFTFLGLLAAAGGGWLAVDNAWATDSAGNVEEQGSLPSLKAGEKIKIDDDHYFIYSFDKKPQMGTVIMKIQIFDNAGKQNSFYEITGAAGMPSMRGAHDTGEKSFKLNKKGDYLLPVDVVMPGEWEVRLQIFKDTKPVFSGKVNFDV